jgi:hypothetical protein
MELQVMAKKMLVLLVLLVLVLLGRLVVGLTLLKVRVLVRMQVLLFVTQLHVGSSPTSPPPPNTHPSSNTIPQQIGTCARRGSKPQQRYDVESCCVWGWTVRGGEYVVALCHVLGEAGGLRCDGGGRVLR